jgi:hypothetical protein
VFAQLTDGLSWASGWSESWSAPSKSAIFQARSRLGFEPVRGLFARVVRTLAGPETAGSWLTGRRLVSIDGTCLDLADTPANVGHSERPASSRGEHAAFPQARLVTLAECGTHATLGATIGLCTRSEITLFRELVARFTPGTLVLADRGYYYRFLLWRQATATGGPALAGENEPAATVTSDPGRRFVAGAKHPHFRHRADHVSAASGTGHRLHDRGREGESRESYRLSTTILDPGEATAEDLATFLRRTENTSAWAENSSAFQVRRPSGATPSSASSNASTRPAENAPSSPDRPTAVPRTAILAQQLVVDAVSYSSNRTIQPQTHRNQVNRQGTRMDQQALEAVPFN